ncbi:helix-turn-helix transcriptional regulator [Ulvibacter litoralis]|uniref:Regulatory protein, luxR family n=1 Tax=Ulvibacter litoralis TaxID=227084 RepID=A0A1G7FFI2_9FLAO|nr:LuxR C-terminal-related transcriptional regulator [Ulvibacter litoralis]GHC51381.1 hypothetical protein GCM10008083_13790 [Ulvibacter litoralis]SDE74627.1 regulatory protein, luxR family [Ulvibacter litoralis]
MFYNFQISLLNTPTTLVYLLLFFWGVNVYAQDEKKDAYSKYLDSAKIYSSSKPKLAAQFLDSIPNPLTKTLKGQLASYYLEKGLIALSLDDIPNTHKYYILAVKYAEIEKDYDSGGTAALGLFSQVYAVQKDTSANSYLRTARDFFKRSGNTLQLLEVDQMPAYIKLIDSEYQESYDLTLANIEASKAVVDEDGYYYLFDLFMLATNALHIDKIDAAKTYYSEFVKLKQNPTVDIGLYNYYDCSIQMCFVHYYFDKKQNDKTLYYLSKASELRSEMNNNLKKDFYRQYSDTYKRMNNLTLSETYLDSLNLLNNKIIDEAIKSNYSTNEELVNIGDELQQENEENLFNKKLLFILGGVLASLLIVFLLSYKKLKKRLHSKKTQIDDLSYLKTNHEKLKIKTQGLEAYISELKEQIKMIATVDTTEGQRGQIKDLYRNIQLKSTNILDEGKTHYELINELNADFFKELKNTYPDLSDSEIIICYYLCIGFKNKEIGTFLNRSTRSIESKRYRISKKIGLSKDTETLLEHLNELFKTHNLLSES